MDFILLTHLRKTPFLILLFLVVLVAQAIYIAVKWFIEYRVCIT
jgi:hypothetical protein